MITLGPGVPGKPFSPFAPGSPEIDISRIKYNF